MCQQQFVCRWSKLFLFSSDMSSIFCTIYCHLYTCCLCTIVTLSLQILEINGSNVTKCRETSTANRSQADNLPPLGSPTLHDIPEGVKLIPVTSHPIKSRSGREIVRPKGNEQFVEEEFPVAKATKMEKYNNDEDLYVPRIKRRCVKNAKYGDDFDYDNEDEGEEYEDFDEDEYASRSLKKKRGLHSDEGHFN